jgi:hypothetical protein
MFLISRVCLKGFGGKHQKWTPSDAPFVVARAILSLVGGFTCPGSHLSGAHLSGVSFVRGLTCPGSSFVVVYVSSPFDSLV